MSEGNLSFLFECRRQLRKIEPKFDVIEIEINYEFFVGLRKELLNNRLFDGIGNDLTFHGVPVVVNYEKEERSVVFVLNDIIPEVRFDRRNMWSINHGYRKCTFYYAAERGS